MKNELVRFKGMGDGVRIDIDSNADIYDIISVLETKIKENKAFFGDGNCAVRFNGRELTTGERQKFVDIIRQLLPLSRVSFNEAKTKESQSNDWIVEYKEKHGARSEEHPAEKVIDHSREIKREKEPEHEFFSVFRSNRARLYQGFVHEGMTIRSDGHLILLGRAEEGSELIAVGNILVMGGLYGSAHAGCNGHNGSYILAMDMHPQKLKIAKTAEKYTYEQPEEEEREDIEEKAKRGIFDKLRKKPEEIEKEPVRQEKKDFSAVALLKNNKIELDNFTIQTFTNPKNMV